MNLFTKKTIFYTLLLAVISMQLFVACNSLKTIQQSEKEGIDEAFKQDFERTKDISTNTLPRERILKAVERQNEIFSSKLINRAVPGIAWQERGPINVGGRIRAVVIDKNDPTNKKVWVGGVGGGIWHTNDITAASPVWIKADDFLDNMAVTSMVQDPNSPNTMYAGTGEGYFGSDAQQGLGIFKSTDGGNSWARLANTSNFLFVMELAFDLNGKLYASVKGTNAAQRGIMRTTDGGATWVQVLSDNTTTVASSNVGCDIKVSKNGDIYVSMGFLFNNGGIYKSPAGATAGDVSTWTNITPPVAGGAPAAPSNEWQRIRLAVSPSDNNVMYAVMQGGTAGPALFKNACRSIQQYDAGANSWTVRTVPKIIDQQSSPATYPLFTRDGDGGQAWYDLSAAVDPNNAATLIVSAIDICKSTDNGASWNQVSVWVNSTNEQAAGFTNNQQVHADHHNIVYVGGSSTTALFATDGGIYYSTDFNTGTNKPTYKAKNSGLNITQLYATAIHPTAGNNYFLDGCQDNGSHKYTMAGLNSVTSVSGGDGGICHISPLNPNNQISAYTNNNYYISTNGGATFPAAVVSNGRGSFINPTDYDGNNMYGADDLGNFFRWLNPQGNAATGTKDTVANFGGGTVTQVAISKQTANRVYFGLDNARVVRVDNANTSNIGVIIGTPRSTGGSISCIASTATNEDSMLVSYSNYGGNNIYVSANGTSAGATFVDITGNLPDMPVRWIMFDPRSHKMAIAATELGVWSCDDITAATPDWTITSSGLARVRVDMLKYRSSDRTLLAATHGRGLFSATIPANLNPEVNFNIGTLTASEQQSATTNTCVNYTDYPAAIIINGAPSGSDATVSINVAGGTATEGKDYDILVNGVLGKTVTIPNGTTDSKPFTIRVYDDAIVDPAETVNLNFTTSGGGSSIGTANATLAITINDNDVTVVAPTASVTVGIGAATDETTVYTPFWGNNNSDVKYQTTLLASELTAAGLSAGSNITALTLKVTAKNSTLPFNNFNISLGHTTSTPSTGSGYLAATGVVSCYSNAAYSTVLGNNVFTFSTPFVWDGTSNVVTNYCFDNSADWASFDILESKADALGAGVRTVVIFQSNQAAGLNGCNLPTTGSFFPTSSRPITTLTHYKPGTGIETVAGNTKVQNLPTATAEYDFISPNNKVIAKITNPSQDLGCVTATVTNDGNGVTIPFFSGQRSFKVWSITPTTNASTVGYSVTLYLTTAELQGADPSTFKIYKSSAANIGAANINNTVTANTTVVSNAEFTTFTATFTGFSIFFIGTNTIALPINYSNFIGTRSNGKNILSWKNNGNGIDKFEIERSYDGVNFKNIGLVNYDANKSQYGLTDNLFYTGTAYYRLKMLTTFGSYTYSYIISISADKTDNISIYPSPAKTNILVSVSNSALLNTYFSIIDSKGMTVKTILLKNPQQQVELSDIASGIYYIKFANGIVKKVVKN